jgi:hypothetical protein
MPLGSFRNLPGVKSGAGFQPAAALWAALLIDEEACWKQAAG